MIVAKRGLIAMIRSVLCAILLITSAAGVATADEGKHLFILSGQSNMRKPLPGSFAAAVSAVFGQENVIVVTTSHPSQPIRKWYRDWAPPAGMPTDDQPNGKLYDVLIAKVKRTIGDQPLATVTFIWMQGEADAGAGWGSVYEKSFLGLVEQIKTDLKREQINFVLGRINDHWLPTRGTKDGDVVRAVQRKLGEDHAHGDWINTDDLNMGVNPWASYDVADGHFPPAGYRVMGQRFALKACKLIDPSFKPDPAIFDAGYIETTDDVKTHAAIGKPVLGTEPLPRLTDGKFGGTAPSGDHHAKVAAESDAVWVLDLGEEKPITSMAVSLLINKQHQAGFPKSIQFESSLDGKTYEATFRRGKREYIQFGYRDAHRLAWNEQLEPRGVVVLHERSFSARYIRITTEAAESHVFIDEVMINARPSGPAVVPGRP